MWLQNRAVAAFNPATNGESESSTGWNSEIETKPALAAEQLREIYAAAETPAERFLVLAL